MKVRREVKGKGRRNGRRVTNEEVKVEAKIPSMVCRLLKS